MQSPILDETIIVMRSAADSQFSEPYSPFEKGRSVLPFWLKVDCIESAVALMCDSASSSLLKLTQTDTANYSVCVYVCAKQLISTYFKEEINMERRGGRDLRPN